MICFQAISLNIYVLLFVLTMFKIHFWFPLVEFSVFFFRLPVLSSSICFMKHLVEMSGYGILYWDPFFMVFYARLHPHKIPTCRNGYFVDLDRTSAHLLWAR